MIPTMTPNDDRINQLLDKLDILLKRQDDFSHEINELSVEINRLKYSKKVEEPLDEKEEKRVIEANQTLTEINVEVKKEPVITTYYPEQERTSKEQPRYFVPKPNETPKVKSDLEKFIGENLINKIGIIITVIGVAIGAKYSIDHQLISPLTRIILGYLVGLGLLGFGIKLKKNYENYSAVLVSGAMAIMYFITYAAYSFYDLIPQVATFMLMVIFTAFTVVAAINYNKQVIAHIGLVGAYAVPFLLSEGSGKVAILFSYMAIINIGILLVAVKKYWKPIYYSSFVLTWLIFFSWYSSKYAANEHFGLTLTFIAIFFATFYVIFLAYKLIQKEKFEIFDVLLLLANSFIFYGIGYSVLNGHETGSQLLGIFTLCNAILHFVVSVLIYRQKLADRNLFYLVVGLVLVFITISIPVQLDGNWVTLLWACEAALLFWLGRTKNIFFYEQLSYVLMILAFISLVQDWSTVYDLYTPEKPETRITPLFNINFLTSLLFIISFGFINILNCNAKYRSPLISQQGLLKVVSILIPAILLIVLYFSFRIEISNYWNQLSIDSAIGIKQQDSGSESLRNTDLTKFEAIWILNYSLLFMTILSFVNIKRLKDRNLGYVNLALNTIVLLVFLLQGLYFLGELRASFLSHTLSEYYQRNSFNIGIRYISFAFVGLLIYSIYKYIQQDFMKSDSLNLKKAFDILLYSTLIWIASSELIAWMDIAKFTQSYKLVLSILWGVCALLIIALGIWKKKKHLRIGAIVLFAATLVKLFFYDISDLDTIAKTIVFVALGILLLIISFLYNKFKHLISQENVD
jgi:uncharacterized membrane protein